MMRKILCVLAASAASLIPVVAPTGASAYMHADTCMSALRYTWRGGDLEGDDDVHNFGVANHLAGWAGFGPAYHPGGATNQVAMSSVFYVWYPHAGPTTVAYGFCWGSDNSFHDRIQWSKP